jgi:hypothetical protein
MPDENAVQLSLDEQLIASTYEEEETPNETNNSQEAQSDN